MSLFEEMKIIPIVLRKMRHVPEDRPRFVQISLTNHCNLSCTMCIRNYIDVDRRHMEWDDFTHIVDQLEGCEQVALAGMGESLTHPRLFDAIRYCKNKGFKVQLTSNALLLGKMGMIERVADSGLDSISFSVESVKDSPEMGHDNVRGLKNIKELIDTRNKKGKDKPRIVLQPILFKDKIEDVYDIIRWSAANGCDRVNVVRVDLRFVAEMSRPTVAEEKGIFREFDRLRKELGVRIDCLQDQVFDGLAG
ncbi:MAG TPA: radical SAM protein, partial [Magnetococcales bacterium]|nr:radical SAM protein [Magnetococcales bacterium]